MRATMTVTLAVVAGSGFAACNPSSFNSVLDKAPVVSFSTGGASTGAMFVLPLPTPSEAGTTSAARMLLTRKDSDYLAIADFDMNGKVTVSKASEVERGNLGNNSVYSAAARSNGTILLGMPRAGGGTQPGGQVSLLIPTPAAGGGYNLQVQPGFTGSNNNLTRVGISVAVGNLTGANSEDFVVVGDHTLDLLGGADVKNPIAAIDGTCPAVQLASAVDVLGFRPVAVGDVLTGGFEEIVLSGEGKVVLVRWNATTVLQCQALPVPTSSPYFGSSLAVGDFDGDGLADLAVGSPPDKVYVYSGPLDSVTAPSMEITNASTTLFGQRVSAYGFPKQLGAQLMVSDPGAAVGDRAGAGKVYLFNLVGLKVPGVTTQLTNANAAAVYFDSNGDAEPGKLGDNLGGLMFNSGLCSPGAAIALVPWASNNTDTLTFFGVAGSATDPRCFTTTP